MRQAVSHPEETTAPSAAPMPLALPAPAARRRPPLAVALLAAAAVLLALGLLLEEGVQRLAIALTAAILFGLAAIQAVATMAQARRRHRLLGMLGSFVEHDAAPCYLADSLGEVSHRNRAAGAADGPVDTLAASLRGTMGSPSGLIDRLQAEAIARGQAREDVVTRRGHVRVSVHAVGEDAFLWRVEELGERSSQARGADALSLPMLTVGPAGTILYMNEAFRRLVGGRPRQLDRVFRNLPLVSGRAHRVEAADGPVDCLVAQVTGAGGRTEIYLLPHEPGQRLPGPDAGWEAIEDLPVPLLKVASSGEVLASNSDARALLAPIGPGTRLSDLLEGPGRPVIEWLTDVAEGRPTAGPQFLRVTGVERDSFLRVALSLAGPPDDLHLIAVLSDVTELKSLEAQFVQSQKMQAIGQLAGGVSHDFNNLLTAISGHCDLLLLRHDEGDPEYGDLIQIHQNANRAASLVRQLLAYSRKQNLMPETLDLRDTLAELTHLLNRLVGERVRLNLVHDPELKAIRADKRQLEQVIMNLVVNARDAMPRGGEIRIETGNERLDRPLERDRATVPAGSYVAVRVVDEGTGIPPDRLPKIFEPFFTTKRPGEGTGLGLSTAYGIIKQTGGYIFADSEVGVGTTFTLLLPAHDMVVPKAPARETPVALTRKGEGVVLLAEDEAPVRAFASRALRLRGYSVLEAESAEAALAILDDPQVVVDLIVTDVIMPGKDGPTWVREALTRRPDLKVVFVSGYAEDTFTEHKTLIPNSVFLPKPFSLVDLATTVHAQLQ